MGVFLVQARPRGYGLSSPQDILNAASDVVNYATQGADVYAQARDAYGNVVNPTSAPPPPTDVQDVTGAIDIHAGTDDKKDSGIPKWAIYGGIGLIAAKLFGII